MDSKELRSRFLDFFKNRGHAIVPSSSLIPGDPSVLLTTAGMQQFKPYYLGEKSPWGQDVASCQKCFRTSDIDEVGDESHLTFFEMLGNFSFGGYFKKEAIKWAYEFIVKDLGLKIEYVTIFKGDFDVPRDEESYEIWREIASDLEIRESGREDNFWGPTGFQGPCGPTTEIYAVNSKGEPIEIWNIVFNEFYCNADKSLERLATPGVDTGMGLERLAMVSQKTPTIFETDLFSFLMRLIPADLTEKEKRIMADHARGIAFLISDGVRPSNKGQGYVLRRLIRRIPGAWSKDIFEAVVEKYRDAYPQLNFETIGDVVTQEVKVFMTALREGGRVLEKIGTPTTKDAFNLYQTYGLPVEWLKENVKNFNERDFANFVRKHQEISRAGSSGMFKGGLVDEKPQTIKHHTAHHLLLAALRQVLGSHVLQRGSNVSSERLRLDFSHPEKMSAEQIAEVEKIVNQKINEGLEVRRQEMPKAEAEKLGALAEFGAKYGEIVSIYSIYNKDGFVFSREFCGGPHVRNTSELGRFKILKEEAVASGIRRIRGVLN